MVKQTLEKPKKKTKKPRKSSKRTKTQHVYVHVKNETGATRGLGSLGSIGPHYAIASPLRPQESTLKSEVQNLSALFKPRIMSREEVLAEREMRHYHNEASARGPSPFRMSPSEAVNAAVKSQLGDDKREKSISNLTNDAKSIAQARRQALLNSSIRSHTPRVFENTRYRTSNAEMSEAGNIGINGYNSTKKSATAGDRFGEGTSGRNEGKPKSPSKVSKTSIEKAVSGEAIGDAGATGIPASISHATDLVLEDFTNEKTGVGLMGGTEPGLNPFTASASAGLSADLLAQTRQPIEPIEPLAPHPSQISKKSEMGILKPAQKEVANAMQSQLLANEGQSIGSEGIAPQIGYYVGRNRLSNRLREHISASESKPAVTSKPGKKSDRLPSFNDSLGNTVGAESRLQFVGKAETKGNDLEADEYPGDRET